LIIFENPYIVSLFTKIKSTIVWKAPKSICWARFGSDQLSFVKILHSRLDRDLLGQAWLCTSQSLGRTANFKSAEKFQYSHLFCTNHT
jgi:hypothetical protein